MGAATWEVWTAACTAKAGKVTAVGIDDGAGVVETPVGAEIVGAVVTARRPS